MANDRALALLREVEWARDGGGAGVHRYFGCHFCEGVKPEQWSWLHGEKNFTIHEARWGHYSDCKLKALLEETDG